MNRVCFILSMSLALAVAYDLMYDDSYYINIVKNERLFNGLIECLVSDEDCANPAFQQLKQLAPEIIETICGNCSALQKMSFKDGTFKFMNIRPEDYDKLLAKYDPNNKFRAPLEEFLKS